ncbi:FAD/NAD(P)-binding protein [Saccharopolyspora sp. ASAGF58]|uniref:FAD/NAD(P)-binding protein n=1 Tax=Saccharopolyspora sp. ASAGF58 TaxID=2719023 RepID=UPI00143FF2AD|nr:FAD/NAD(P)-binding protein [Saccharopolyspora sp. ASAGF58]QIZ36579.1 FAD/NAD(P)-binding protein [Saccharopolyspora sp. ASAGF58]
MSATLARGRVRVAVVGAGPKGTMMVNRLCAFAASNAGALDLEIDVVEPFVPGAGRVWRVDQAWSLLMNTAAAEATVFPPGPSDLTGPSVHDWAVMVREGLVDGLPSRCREFAAAVEPQTAVPRAFYGAYLEWAFRFLVRQAREAARIRVHRGSAVSVTDLSNGRQRLLVDNGIGALDVDAVVLTQGHYAVGLGSPERVKASAAQELGLIYIPPMCAAEADLSGIAAGAPVILNGLGLSFYDYVTLLTTERGGRFRLDAGRLRYEPSGTEPVIYAGSERGVPYPVRADFSPTGDQPYVPRFLTKAAVTALRESTPGVGDFKRDVWPLLAKELGWTFYTVQYARLHGTGGFEAFSARYAAASWDSSRMRDLIAEFFPQPWMRWDWDRHTRPAADRRFRDPAEFGDFATEYHRSVLDEAAAGVTRSPHRAVTAALRRLRELVRLAVCHHGIAGSSYRRDIENWFDGLSKFLVWGPPPVRVEELLALLDAGVVRLTGPRTRVAFDRDTAAFTAESAVVDQSRVTADVLIDARLPSTDVRNATDPLVASMLAAGDCRAHVISDAAAPPGYPVGSLDVTENVFTLVRSDGRAHPRRFAYGVPLRGILGPFGTALPAVVEHCDAIAATACATGTGTVTASSGEAMTRLAGTTRQVGHG